MTFTSSAAIKRNSCKVMPVRKFSKGNYFIIHQPFQLLHFAWGVAINDAYNEFIGSLLNKALFPEHTGLIHASKLIICSIYPAIPITITDCVSANVPPSYIMCSMFSMKICKVCLSQRDRIWEKGPCCAKRVLRFFELSPYEGLKSPRLLAWFVSSLGLVLHRSNVRS